MIHFDLQNLKQETTPDNRYNRRLNSSCPENR